MSKRGDAIATKDSVINVLIGFNVITMSVVCFLAYGLITMRHTFSVSIPPNIQNGAIVKVDEFNTSAVHAFTSMIFRGLHRWEDDGFVDYGKRIEELAPYFTAEYYEYLKADMNFKNSEGELADRTRYAQEIVGNDINHSETGLVEIINDNTWLVNLTVTIVERISDFEVKNKTIKYPLIVRRGNIDPQNNEWGLLIDGYPDEVEPEVIKEYESKIAG